MSSTVVGTFNDATKADLAVIALERTGILPENVSVIETDADSEDSDGTYEEENPYLPGIKRKVRKGANFVDSSDHTKDAPLYTIIGCIGGVLVGAIISAVIFTQPATRHLIDAEPVVFFIGGSTIGGILGGSIAALSSSSRKYTELRYYRQAGNERYVVAIDCTRDQAPNIVKVLNQQGGEHVKYIPELRKTSATKSKKDALLEQSGFLQQ